jgi:hypothetical protein
MFEQSKSFSKRGSRVLPLVLLLCTRCLCTTAVFVITPRRIVAGLDRLAVQPDATGHLVRTTPVTKIVLLGGRFIVACIGLEQLKTGPPDKQIVVYNFPRWIRRTASRIGPDTSVSRLANIVKDEMIGTFTQTVPIESMMRNGTFKHTQGLDQFLVQFVVCGFDHGIVSLIEINYELDWKKNLLIGPTPRLLLPKKGIDTALYSDGVYDAITTAQLSDPNSYAHKRMEVLAPTAFKKILASQATERMEAVRSVRALITVEAEVKPSEVGAGASIVVLPLTGDGVLTEYKNPLSKTDSLKPNKQH